jgi:hypothetical protein
MIPSRLRIYGLPVTLPMELLQAMQLSREDLDNWKAWYGLDFSTLREASQISQVRMFVTPQKCAAWTRLSEPCLFADIDLRDPPAEVCNLDARATIATDGALGGVLVFFEADLGPGTVLTTDPCRVGPDNHWKMPLLVTTEAVQATVGDIVQTTYFAREKNGYSDMMSLVVSHPLPHVAAISVTSP